MQPRPRTGRSSPEWRTQRPALTANRAGPARRPERLLAGCPARSAAGPARGPAPASRIAICLPAGLTRWPSSCTTRVRRPSDGDAPPASISSRPSLGSCAAPPLTPNRRQGNAATDGRPARGTTFATSKSCFWCLRCCLSMGYASASFCTQHVCPNRQRVGDHVSRCAGCRYESAVSLIRVGRP
jgi:hypothetical protein